jgi:hypothetical protein
MPDYAALTSSTRALTHKPRLQSRRPVKNLRPRNGDLQIQAGLRRLRFAILGPLATGAAFVFGSDEHQRTLLANARVAVRPRYDQVIKLEEVVPLSVEI